ncbi:MAG: enoyl-CoA hydratase/isomerase family protein [Syntrophales bacterium]|nr:enoyl-CoA hydratase/isomerase family protein [Syntrophales bacterium]
MNGKTIILEKKTGYAIVTLNRPNEMNALSQAMRNELESCFIGLEDDPDVRAIILTGGDYVFSAGMDIKEMAVLPDHEIDEYFKSIVSYLKRIYICRKPVIAAVGGIALGGGFNLAIVCDLIIASESAIFGHPELKFGLNPLFNPLRQIVGLAKAKEIAMLGEPLGAKEAFRIGLVNKVASPETFMQEAMIMAEELSKRSARAIAAVKKVSMITPQLDSYSALELEFGISAQLFSKPERKAHMNEFIFIEQIKKRRQQ